MLIASIVIVSAPGHIIIADDYNLFLPYLFYIFFAYRNPHKLVMVPCSEK